MKKFLMLIVLGLIGLPIVGCEEQDSKSSEITEQAVVQEKSEKEIVRRKDRENNVETYYHVTFVREDLSTLEFSTQDESLFSELNIDDVGILTYKKSVGKIKPHEFIRFEKE